MIDSNSFNSRGESLLSLGKACWNSAAPFRASRLRNKNYAFGNQWGDPITVDGITMTEEEYIMREGNIPLKNNLIRRLVRNVLGVFRERLADTVKGWEEADRRRASLNNMEELYARTMEEYLISGMAVHRKWIGRRDGIAGVWTESVSPDAFFFDPLARDFRGHDLTVVGQIHELPTELFLAEFARDEEEYARLSAVYGGEPKVRVMEIWRRSRLPRRLLHDPAAGRLLRVDEEVWRNSPSLRRMRSRWLIDDVWRYAFVTSSGEVLREGDSPLPGGGHPFVFAAYPFLDGEIHSFVGDMIDQQRYTNRLITLYDWVIRASAKGVLLFPEDALPEDADLQEVVDQWSRFNGVIVYRPKTGQPLPQQVSGNAANVGISELLDIQLKMMEDVSGVSGALQGRLDSNTISGTLYNQQTQNSMTSLRDLLDTFDAFVADSLSLEHRLSQENF